MHFAYDNTNALRLQHFSTTQLSLDFHKKLSPKTQIRPILIKYSKRQFSAMLIITKSSARCGTAWLDAQWLETNDVKRRHANFDVCFTHVQWLSGLVLRSGTKTAFLMTATAAAAPERCCWLAVYIFLPSRVAQIYWNTRGTRRLLRPTSNNYVCSDLVRWEFSSDAHAKFSDGIIVHFES